MITQARLIIAGLAVLAVLCLVGYVWYTRDQLKNARARVVTAEQSTELAKDTGEITERTLRTEVIIHDTAERQADVVQSAPGADALLDPAFAGTLRSSIGVMRERPQASVDRSAGDPEGPVPEGGRRTP